MNLIFLSKYTLLVIVLGISLGGCREAADRPPVLLETIALPRPADNPLNIAANPQTGYVYVVNSSGHVSVLQGEQVVKTLRVEDQAFPAIAVDQERGWVYVTNTYSASVSVIRETEVITNVALPGRRPNDVAVDPQTGWAYVVTANPLERPAKGLSPVDGKVTVIEAGQIIGVIPLGDKTLPTAVTVDPVNSYVYVGGAGGNVVIIKGLEEIARFNVGSAVKALDVAPHTGEVYTLARPANYRQLTRFKKGELIDNLQVEGEGGSVVNMRVHPTTGDVYITDLLRYEAIVVRDMEVIGRVPVGWHPAKLDIDPVTGNVYVLNTKHGTVTVIQETNVLTTVRVGGGPYGLGVNPADGRLYVSNTNVDTVSVLGVE